MKDESQQLVTNWKKKTRQKNKKSMETEMGKNCMNTSSKKNNEIAQEKRWTWVRKWQRGRKTEFLLIAVQNNAIRCNYIKTKIDYTQQNSKDRLSEEKDQLVNHLNKRCQQAEKRVQY